MSDSGPQGNIAFVVMPPGHGKSFYHNPSLGIIEADTLVPCRSTIGLLTLRTEAKRTDNWVSYDMLWTTLLTEALKDYTNPIILLVPSAKVGHHGGWVDLGGLLLSEPCWERNFQHRPDSHVKWIPCWETERGRGGQVCASNSELSTRLTAKLDFWKRVLSRPSSASDPNTQEVD